MPSTRQSGSVVVDGRDLPDDWTSDSDPDYREESADEYDDELPPSMARDRAEWVVANAEAVEELYKAYKEVGTLLFGRAFFQCGNITPFAHFVYKHSMPGAQKI